MTVTFFGHSDAPESIRPKIKEILKKLIIENNTETFYVGNQGSFDRMVIGVLSELKEIYPDFEYYVVFAYLPEKDYTCAHPSVFPEKAAMAPKRFAISKRNDWMLEQSDTVVVYVRHSTGGAAKFKEKAEKKNKNIINIAEQI